MKNAEKLILSAILVGGLAAALVAGYFFLVEGEGDALPGFGDETVLDTPLEAPSGNGAAQPPDGSDIETVKELLTPEGKAAMDGEDAPASASRASKTGKGTGVVTGRVLSEFGDPLPASEIILRKGNRYGVFSVHLDDPKGMDALAPHCTSGADGRFRLTGAAEMDHATLHVSYPDYVPVDFRFGYFDGMKKNVGEITLEMGGGISGYVTDPSGKPIEGAKVRANPTGGKQQSTLFFFGSMDQGPSEWRTTAGKDGFYRIRGLPEGKVTITGLHPEYAAASLKNVEVAKGRENAKADLVLEEGRIIAGKVLDKDQDPVVGAKVTADPVFDMVIGDGFEMDFSAFLSNDLKTETDEEGAFLLKGLKDKKYTLRVRASGYVTEKVKDVKAGTENLVCVLSPGGRLFGRIVDAQTNEEVETFDIKVKQRGSDSKIEVLKGKEALAKAPSLKDAAGAFCIEGLNDKSFNITASAEGYGDEMIAGLNVKPGKGLEQLVKLWPECKVSGKVFTAAGAPLEDAVVKIRTPKKKLDFYNQGEAFEITETNVEYSLDGAMRSSRESWSKKVKSREDGSFQIRGIPKGEFEITASHEDHLDPKPLPITLKKGEAVNDLSLSLRAAGSIAGTVYGLDGRPKPRARVSCVRIGSHGVPAGGEKKVTADEDAHYGLKGLDPGLYRVRLAEAAESGGLILANIFVTGERDAATKDPSLVLVEEGKETSHDVYETAKGRVEGVVSEAGHPVEDLAVKLFKDNRGNFSFVFMPHQTTTTDSFGAYTFEDLEPGSYKIQVEIAGLSPESGRVDLMAGGVERLNFSLPTGRVSGRILDELTSDPAPGVRVALERVSEEKGDSEKTSVMSFGVVTSGGGGTFSFTSGVQPVKTDENGFYEFRFVQDGKYKLTASGAGFAKGTLQPIDVTEGRDLVNQNLKLIPSLEVSGIIIDGTTGKKITSYVPMSYVRLEKGEEIEDGETAYSSTIGQGSFSFPDLAPGTYRLEIKGSSEYTGSLDITLKDQDIKNLEFIAQPK